MCDEKFVFDALGKKKVFGKRTCLENGIAPSSRPTPPVKVGVLGGSISFGAELQHLHSERWSAQLQRMLPLGSTVLNRAMPSTGVSNPSFCLESLIMPEARHLDYLLLEFNFNDA